MKVEKARFARQGLADDTPMMAPSKRRFQGPSRAKDASAGTRRANPHHQAV
ncbi:hypothetical protein K7W42_03130 [Deinococcus sp. HMF7604]|uniref:hypothetical protein n=1 Tax=Deinococcus betulae TaxID=2873312 RepID=UPI001CCD24CD|nr:hypothetical protein [Deinococcus betulae]MBZ9749851.1 hypothetical protein [Deinococcus betulae]